MHPSSAPSPSSRKTGLLLMAVAGIAVLCALVWAWTGRHDSIGALLESPSDEAPSQASAVNVRAPYDVEIHRLLAGPHPAPREAPTPESLRGSDAFDPAVNRLLGLIRADLPAGWKASYQKEFSVLEVSRNRPVLSRSSAPNSDPFARAEMTGYSFAFRVLAPVSPDKYRQLESENKKTERGIRVLYDALVNGNANQKFDSFSPRYKSQEPLVARYDALNASLHDLPDFYFGEISLSHLYPGYVSPIDERERAECQRVRDQVEKLLSKY